MSESVTLDGVPESGDLIQRMQPVSRTSLSDMIVEQIIDLISRGILKPGDRLPSERDLCKRFGVGRTSLREALRSLTVMGILESRVGEGTFVSRSNSRHLERSLQWGFLLDEKKVQDLIETRLMLELETARLAAQRATPQDVAEMGATVEGMAVTLAEPEAFLAHDLEFHLLVATASKNSILSSLLGTTRGYLQEWIVRTLGSRDDGAVEERAGLSVRQHELIIAEISAGRPKAASRRMSEHILSSSADLRSAL